MSQKRIRSRIVLLLGSALLVCGSLFLSEIVSIYWHVRFGDSTTFHGWRIPVPRGWYAATRNDLLIIQKATRFYDSEDAPTITPDILSPRKPVDPERLKQASIQVISKQGYLFQEERPFRIGTDSGYCLHFIADKNQKHIHISCESLAAQLSVGYFGPNSEIQTFYSVIGQIKRQDMH